MTFLEQALEVAAEAAERADLLELAGASATSAGHYGAAQSYLERALDHRREIGDRVATASTVAQLGRAMLAGRQTGRALDMLDNAATEFADLAPDPAVVGLQAQLARACFLNDLNERALEIAEQVLVDAERGNLMAILADILVTKGTALSNVGRSREGMGVIEIGERIARAEGLSSTVLRGLNNRSISLFDFDPRAARDATLDALALARRIGDRQWMLQFMSGSGWSSFDLGEWDKAIDLWQAVLAEDPEPADRILPVFSLAFAAAARAEPITDALAEIARLAGQITDPQVTWVAIDAPASIALAGGHLSEAMASWRAGFAGYPTVAPRWRWNTARLAIRLGDADAARRDLAANDALGRHTPRDEAERLGVRAGLAALGGESSEALRLYGEAFQVFRELGLVFVEAQTSIEMATVLDPALPEVSEAVDSARATLARLRAKAYLDQLDAATQRSTRETTSV